MVTIMICDDNREFLDHLCCDMASALDGLNVKAKVYPYTQMESQQHTVIISWQWTARLIFRFRSMIFRHSVFQPIRWLCFSPICSIMPSSPSSVCLITG